MISPPLDVTQLLRTWGGGDHKALDRLFSLLCDELRRQVARQLRATDLL